MRETLGLDSETLLVLARETAVLFRRKNQSTEIVKKLEKCRRKSTEIVIFGIFRRPWSLEYLGAHGLTLANMYAHAKKKVLSSIEF